MPPLVPWETVLTWPGRASLILPSMASRITEPARADVTTTSAASAASVEGARRYIAPIALTTITLACAVALLFPVIAAPVNADDRYWYLMIGPRADGSVINILQWSWDNVATEVQSGRLATLAAVERRIVGMWIIEAAVSTATPIVVFQALAKLLMVALGVLTVVSFVKALRWRHADGRLVAASRRTTVLVSVASLLAVAVGAQAHSQFRNGWTSYAVLTYGAVIFIFGSIAFVLWTTRLVAERSRGTAILVAASLVVLAAVTNISYELVYPAVPAAALALLLVPVTDRSRRRQAMQAKLITGSAYVAGFTVIFVTIRRYIASLCANTECYAGVSPELGLGAVRTAFYNLVTAVPGAGDNEIRADLERVGWEESYPVLPTAWSIVIGLLATAALLLAWWSTRHLSNQSGAGADAYEAGGAHRAEAVMLGIGAGIALTVALGTAAIMGISVQAQELILEPGMPYRNTMVTWSALAVTAILAVISLGLVLPRPAGLVAWTALASVVAVMAALLLPTNMMALRAHRAQPSIAVTDAISWEVVLGDTGPGADQRRCETFERLGEVMSGGWTRDSIYRHANIAFQHYHSQPFCSELGYPGNEG